MAILFVALSTSSVSAQADEEDQRIVTKIYQVGDLLQAPSLLDDSKTESSTRTRGGFGGGGMGGMGGGMGGGGGGMMRVPDDVLPQFGGGMGGMGGMPVAQGFPQTMTQTALSELILSHVEPDAWEQLGGRGSLSIVGSMMIISQTAAVHAQVDQLLSLLRKTMGSETSVEVDVRVIELAAEANPGELSKTADALSKLASDPAAARLSLRCNNHQVSQVSSGVRRSYVVSITPVVGGNDLVTSNGRGTAYQPATTSLLLGMRGKIQPEIASDKKSGRIHMGIALASGPEEVVSANFGTGQTIDRVELEIAELETAVVASVDQWTLAGTVAVCDPATNITSGQALPHLVVLVKWKLVP